MRRSILQMISLATLSLSSLQAQDTLSWRSTVDSLMNRWHHAATTADEDSFWDLMTEGAIYIGTDATEYWTREDMRAWAQPYFDRDTAWAFTPISRHAYLHDSGNLVWMDELLDTWMGICRSSAVLTLDTTGAWRITHYHLSIAVPNELVKDYLKLLKPEDEE